MKTVKKVWGEELWIVNNDKYCGKILTVKKGFRCALHYHKKKHETFYVLEGNPYLEVSSGTARKRAFFYEGTAKEGDDFEINPYVIHRFSAPTGEVKIIEFSTHHEDSDSYREVLSGRIKNTKTNCDLCKLFNDDDIKTRFYFKTSLITVVDCLTCKIPMAVFFQHGREPTEKESKSIERQCREHFSIVEGKEISKFRKVARKIKNHTHWHIMFKGEK